MLLVAMIGGIVLAGKKKMNESYSEMKEDEIDEKSDLKKNHL